MRREKALGGVAVAVAVGTVLVLVLVPNAIAAPERPEPPEDPVPPTELGIRDVSISDGPVSGATATIEVDVRLTHQGGPAENVTVEVRAIDGESGMVKMTERTDLGDVTRTGERRVRTDLSVPRQGSYRIETIAYLNGTRIDEGTARVSGVGSLTPAYADSPVSFRRTGGFGPAGPLPSVEYAIEDVESVHNGRDRVTVGVESYLTNGGDETFGDLRLVVKARQADSNIVADEAAVSVDRLRPGRSATPRVSLTVADEYNYYLDAVLWRDGVVLDTTRSAANLLPNRTLAVNRSERESGLRVGDFDRSDPDEVASQVTQTQEVERTVTVTVESGSGGDGPGLGAAVALVAVVLGGVLAARRGPDDESGGESR